MEKKDKKIERWTKSTLLKRGWTQKSINELLPPPELFDNPHYKCASPMNLWDSKIVKQKERTKKFKEYAEKKAKRQEASIKAVETKKANTMSLLPTLDLEVERIDIAELQKRAIDSKNSWYYYTGQFDKLIFMPVDDETMLRWELNYIRHNLSNYDYEIQSLYGLVGKDEVYHKYRKELMNKIFEVYPELAEKDEEICNRNIAKVV